MSVANKLKQDDKDTVFLILQNIYLAAMKRPNNIKQHLNEIDNG